MSSSFDRRHFLQGSAALGGTLLAGSVPLHRSAAAASVRIDAPVVDRVVVQEVTDGAHESGGPAEPAPHDEVFQPADLHALIRRSGLRLVQPIDEQVYQRYEYVAVDLYQNRFQTPHMVVRMGETVFTSVMVFLEKA